MPLTPVPQVDQGLLPPDARLAGRWQRVLLERATGERDTTSEVTWLQAGEVYVDLRLPAHGSPEGFGGRLVTADGCARWERTVDLLPPTGSPDQGHLDLRQDLLVETGADGSYTEHWARSPEPALPASGALLTSPLTGESAVLVQVGPDTGWARPGEVSLVRDGVVRRSSSPDRAGQPLQVTAGERQVVTRDTGPDGRPRWEVWDIVLRDGDLAEVDR